MSSSNHRRVHAFVLAGGAGTRLQPLTQGQCKPAVPFGGNHRVIDFVLGNLWNSEIAWVDLLVQHQPESLIQHVHHTWWRPSPLRRDPFVRIVQPEAGSTGYRGTADAVFQNLHRLDASGADLVLVFGADHVYRMDVQQMIDFHLAHGADATVATVPVPLADAPGFGIVDANEHGLAVAFNEKPRQPRAMPGRPGHAMASMGNYIFSAQVLRQELAACVARGETDFGQHLLPRLLQTHQVMAYDFLSNRVPGLAPHEEAGYWRDVGTLDAYFDAHLDTLGAAPRFSLDNPHWPVVPHINGGDAPRVADGHWRGARVAAGASVDGAMLDRSVVGRDAHVGRGARLERCIVLDGAHVGAGARLRNVIVDRDNHIPAGERIGHDPARDSARFKLSAGGIVIVPRGHFAEPAPMPLVTLPMAGALWPRVRGEATMALQR